MAFPYLCQKKMKNLNLMLALLCAVPLAAQTGDFKGSLKLPQGELPLVFHFDQMTGVPAATMDSPAQGAFDIPIDLLRFFKDSVTLEVRKIQMHYEGHFLNDSVIEGTFSQGGASLPLTLRRTSRDTASFRPGTPQPPFPYREEEVTIKAKDGVALAGTLTQPATEGPHPAVLLISGSGPSDRDEKALNYRPFFMIADYLTRQGFAVLRMDDRGVGKSGGTYKATTLQSAAADAECALDYLLRRKDIRPSQTGLAGHSLGGTIAFHLAAARPRDVAFVVSLAGMAVPGRQLMASQCEALILRKLTPARQDALRKDYARFYDLMAEALPLDTIRARSLPLSLRLWKQTGDFPQLFSPDVSEEARRSDARLILQHTVTPEIVSLIRHDPSEDLRQTRCPVWAANGEKDTQVSARENLAAVRKCAEEGGNRRVTTRLYAGLNHLFIPARTGDPSEYWTLKGNFSPQVLRDMAAWMRQVLGLPENPEARQ